MLQFLKIDKEMWNKNYTVMTLGSFISYFGNAAISFILGLWVYNWSGSVLFYGIYRAAQYFSSIFAPIIIGSVVDGISKQKVIYIMDFTSAGLYFFIFIYCNFFILNYLMLILVAALISCIDSIYNVAFSSLYPTLVKSEKLEKAYSIKSLMDNFSCISVPLAIVFHNFFGTQITLLASSVIFLIAAIFETLPKIDENIAVKTEKQRIVFIEKLTSVKRNIHYFTSRRGVFLLSVFFIAYSFFILSVWNTVLLPFCNQRFDNGELWYFVVSAFGGTGVFYGGMFKLLFKTNRKLRMYSVFLLNIVSSIMLGVVLYMPLPVMCVISFLSSAFITVGGTITRAAIQRNIDDYHRGRYYGYYSSLCCIGQMVGAVVSGLLADRMSIPLLFLISSLFYLAIFIVLYISNRRPIERTLLSDVNIEEGHPE